MFGPLRDPADLADVFGGDMEDIELDDLPREPSRTSTYYHSQNIEATRHDTSSGRHDLESQRLVAKPGGVVLELLTLCCCLSTREIKQNARAGKCDKCLNICLIAKNSFCALLAVALTCLIIALLVLVIRNIPQIDLTIQKVAQIATGLDPQVPPR
jgi:hypothetical protein